MTAVGPAVGEGVLALRGVSVRYRTTTWRGAVDVDAVRGVDLSVGRGQVLGLVGESGCGKSSIARAVVGLAQPSAGEILLDGTPLGRRRRPAQRRAIQMVFQNPRASLNPRRTVRAALLEAIAVMGRTDGAHREHELHRLLDSVSLPSDVLDRYPDQISGGQCQRVAIARALALRPEFLIADEATAALDATVAAGVVALFRRLADEQDVGVVLITHDLHTVEWAANDVAVMYLGRIVEQGPAAAVLTRPRHPYTACLLDARPTLGPREGRRFLVRGEPGNEPADGCSFAPRCPFAAEVCWSSRPRRAAGPHLTTCHHPLDVPDVEPDFEEIDADRVPGA